MKQGQTLIILLVFMIIAITVTSSSVALTIANSRSSDDFSQSLIAHQIAESAMENALIRLLRNPNYVGESLDIGGGIADITVTGTTTKTITTTAKLPKLSPKFIRKIQVIATDNGSLTINTWKEIN